MTCGLFRDKPSNKSVITGTNHDAIRPRRLLKTESSRCQHCHHRSSSYARPHPADTLRNNDVVITSKRHFDVIKSKWHGFDLITMLSLRHVFRGQVPPATTHLVTLWQLSVSVALGQNELIKSYLVHNNKDKICLRADSTFGPSQWETALLCNDVSHWLGAKQESVRWFCRGRRSHLK